MVCQAPRESEPGLTSVQQGPAKPEFKEALVPDGSRCALHSLIDCGLDAGAGPCKGEGIGPGPGHELRQKMEDVDWQLAEVHVADEDNGGGESRESACAEAAYGGRVRRVMVVRRQGRRRMWRSAGWS